MNIINLIWDFVKNFFTTIEECETIPTSSNKGNKMKKIVDAISGDDGTISFILLEGEETFITVKDAIERTKNGEIDAEVIVKPITIEYLRTKADGIKENNLDYLAEKHK